MRVKRLRKFRNKNWSYVLCMKLGLIFYSMTFSILYLTGYTSAYFNDNESVTGVIQAGTWWDKSSLTFVTKQNQTKSDALCTSIDMTIKNAGDGNRIGPVRYEVWWAETGNPKNGLKVSEGEVKALNSGESEILSHSPDKEGTYKFKAFQSEGHPGQGELWSEDLKVNCSESQPEEEKKEDHNSAELEEEQQPPTGQELEESIEPTTPEAEENTSQETAETASENQQNENQTDENLEGNQSETKPETEPVKENETQKDDSK
ncbi:amyloid fiber anchoring/assembly protein TapA [Fictibacillus phosphorivorans]|uniref:amyloid fiber anchoring/assembly protein TapA n=1 Tax=Fictibacillus phosphorivorans TaxID=1221500 RepID=UPI002AD2BD4C|nr:amyloid fiber anchoring/assembly protein TapA [Fictibacillus phosphorivorans]